MIVGFPVTPLLLTRIRFCVSAGHTRDDILFAIKEISETGDILDLKFNQQ